MTEDASRALLQSGRALMDVIRHGRRVAGFPEEIYEPGEWQPIETAPKDGTDVDLWMVDETGEGWREPDARWVVGYCEQLYEYAADGSYKNYSRKRDGWWSNHHGYDNEGDFLDVPRHFNPHPRQNREIYTEATHWMPLPEPPA